MCLVSFSHSIMENSIFFYEDIGTSISSIASLNNNLFIIREDGFFQYDTLEKTEKLIDSKINSNWRLSDNISCLLTDQQELYGYNSTNKLLVKLIDKKGDFVNEVVFDGTNLGIETAIGHPLLHNGKLIYLSEEEGFLSVEKNQKIEEINIKTDEKITFFVEGVIFLEKYKDGQYLALTQARDAKGIMNYSISSINPNTQQTNQIFCFDKQLQIGAISYDFSTDTIYCADREKIYSVQNETEQLQLSAYISPGDLGTMTVISETLIAIIVDNSLVIRNIDISKNMEQKSLLIQDPSGRGEEYKSFMRNYPNVELRFWVDNSISSNEERFIQDMLTQSSEIDIYTLSDKNLLSVIKNKEYGIDMSTSSIIKDSTDKMYPSFFQLFVLNDKILAFPKNVFTNLMSYNPDFFSEFDFIPPKTYDQLLDLTKLWLEEYADEHPNIYFNPFAHDLDIIKLLEHFTFEMESNNTVVNYSDEVLKNTIEKYLEVKNIYNEKYANQNNYYFDVHVFNTSSIFASGNYEYLLLSFYEKNIPVISSSNVDLTYFVINPLSQNKMEAINFVESCERDLLDMEKALLYSTNKIPVEDKYFRSELSQREIYIEGLKQQLETIAPEEKQELEELILQEIKNLESFIKEGQWSIRQEEIDKFDSIKDYIFIGTFNPFDELVKESSSLIIQLEGGNINADTFLQEISSKVQIIIMENSNS